MKQVNQSEKEKNIHVVDHIVRKNTENVEEKTISSSFKGDEGRISNKVFPKY